MVEHLYNSQQQKNDFFSFHQSVILVSFMTLFINLLAVLQSLTTMYKENDYVPNSTIIGVFFCFSFVLFYKGQPFGLLSDYETFCYREPSHAPSSSVNVVLRHILCMSLHFQCLFSLLFSFSSPVPLFFRHLTRV